MSFIDMSSQPPSAKDFDEAIAIVKKTIIRDIGKVPPELAVNLPNILRCLQHGKGSK